MFLNFILFIFSNDPLCPVKSFMMYKRHLNPKCSLFVQRPSKGESPVKWYTIAPVCHNAIGDMMPTIRKVQDFRSDTRTTRSGQLRSIYLIVTSLRDVILLASQFIDRRNRSRLTRGIRHPT